jgi:uncharacterized protein Usg
MIIREKVIATVDILYWMPDYENILQQFMWQTTDYNPEYPRIHEFLNFWKDNIDAVIAEVSIADTPMRRRRYRNAKAVFDL